MANDCRTCVHNTYRDINTEWVSCMHPVTLAKTPAWKAGDPAMVNYRTGDVPVSQIRELANCPTWEEAPDPAPYCSYGHPTKASCDCLPIAENE